MDIIRPIMNIVTRTVSGHVCTAWKQKLYGRLVIRLLAPLAGRDSVVALSKQLSRSSV